MKITKMQLKVHISFLPHWCLRVVGWAALQLLSLMEDGGICFSITDTLTPAREVVEYEIQHQKLSKVVNTIKLNQINKLYTFKIFQQMIVG